MLNQPKDVSSIPFFIGFSNDQLETLVASGVNKRYSRGETVFSEGEDGHGLFIVLEGSIKVFKVSADGKELILNIFGQGEPFGEAAIFLKKPYPATAQALNDSRLAFFPRSDFIEVIGRDPSLALNMLAVLSKRLHEFTMQVETLSFKKVPARLAAYLLHLQEGQGGKDVILPIPKGQLASLLGTIPQTLSRIFAKMTDMGLIAVERQTIRLLDPGGLLALSLGDK